MLYLTRKSGQSIIINGVIEIKVVEVKGKTVKLGCEFPPSASILRKELADKIAQQNLAASQSSDDDSDAWVDFASRKKKDEPESSDDA